MNCAWISDIQRALTIEIIAEYIQLWDLLYEFQLQPDVEDSHIWRLSTDGQYSAKSGYDNLFLSATLFKPCGRIWKSWVPLKCRLFFWLVSHKRCWTSDQPALLDLGPSCTMWTVPFGEMPALWSGGWEHWSSSSFMCILKTILVSCLATGWPPFTYTTTNIPTIWWLVGEREHGNFWFDSKRVELANNLGSMDNLESSQPLSLMVVILTWRP
jgi:hypothetical protein